MTRLIDADAMKKSIEELKRSPWFNSTLNPSWHAGIKEALEVVELVCIDKEPTIDAVPKEKILLFLNIAKEQLSKAHADKSMNGIMTWNASVTTLEGLLKEYDTADTDIVPVIRCKGCAFWDSEDGKKGYCNGFNLVYRKYDADYYCATAERKTDEH